MEMGYFKQKIYEISGVPKSSLEQIDEEPLTLNEVMHEHKFEKFVKYLIKTKSSKNI